MKKVISILLATLMIFSSFGVGVQADNVSQIIGDGNTVVFVDVPANYWARNEIQYFAEKNIVTGTGNDAFEPDKGVTREEFTKMLVLTFNAALVSPTDSTFSDVASNRWSYAYVEACKDFLTGYANPFGGKSAFHPTEYATREDIAVALVRMMGLTDSDVENPNYAKNKFVDAGSISPQLLKYVSLATERGLINGYPDRSFGPTKGITRAETVVLLNRATKQAVSNINAELKLSASITTAKDPKNITIHITSEEGAKVTVDGKIIAMTNNGNSEYEGAFSYKFEAEGSKTFQIEATKAGKKASTSVTAKYAIAAPIVTVTQCPTTSIVKTVTIAGKISDANDSYPVITVNGASVSVRWDGFWSTSVSLKNEITDVTIIATNRLGKTTTIEKTITLGLDAPTLNITRCPSTSNTSTASISGDVSDSNDSRPVVSINGASVSLDSYRNTWSTTVNLKEGENKFTIVATNSFGKTTTIEKTITFGIGAPTLNIINCPSTSNTKFVTISGDVSDANDSRPVITLNGASISLDFFRNTWGTTVSLIEGENKFTILATNKLGKTTTIEKTITYTIDSPVITFTNCPDVTNRKTLYIEGNISVGTRGVKFYIDDKEISLDNNKFSKNVVLNDGNNTFVFRAINSDGKSTSIVKTIKHAEILAPVLTVNDVPTTSTEKVITISGNVNDNLDATVEVRINDNPVSSSNGNFTGSITLNEGSNDIIITASNRFGKSITIVKKVTYTAPASE